MPTAATHKYRLFSRRRHVRHSVTKKHMKIGCGQPGKANIFKPLMLSIIDF
jgi:hypothetical protein